VAAVVLGRRGDRSVAWPLSALLNDPSEEVRKAAAHALRQLEWKPSTGEDLARYQSGPGHARAAASALNPLLGELRHDTAFLRRAAAEALQEINDPGRIAPLLRNLTDSDPGVRLSAIHALDSEREEFVTVELLKLLRDRDQNVRMAAVQVVSRRIESPPAHFLPLLKDPHFEIRVAAVQFLGKFSHPEISVALAPLLSDPDNDVRLAVAKALGEVRSASALRPLILALADEEPQVRSAAEYALEQIDRNWLQREQARLALPDLEQLLTQRPGWVRASILHILEHLRGT
jgi:HEAT repeat protein